MDVFIQSRRDFLKSIGVTVAVAAMPDLLFGAQAPRPVQPNVILMMADDLGWGDVGFNGNTIIKTPHLDALAAGGIRMDRFYSGAPVCSPTRGSCLTGRHPYRYGIVHANQGHMKKEEITLAEVLKAQGYRTGHFGKWHLGTLTTKIKDSNRGGPGNTNDYSPPWENGFDVCFSAEAKVPTWDPMKIPIKFREGNQRIGWPFLGPDEEYQHYGTYYWLGSETMAVKNLNGDDSRIIMDRAVPFIQKAAADNTPFFAVIWFHTPHLPVVAGPKYAAMYKEHELYKRNYYGCITAMDEQVGRLVETLRSAGVGDNTMLWFCSDNGPEGNKSAPGSTKGLKGRKRSLYEGGVRVPGFLAWPDKVKNSRTVTMPCSTSDYFPTVLDVLGYQLPEAKSRPYDGVSLLPLIESRMTERPRPIGFESKDQISIMDNRFKLYSMDLGKSYQLYDLLEDPNEQIDIAAKQPDVLNRMKKTLESWRESCSRSAQGKDY